jgi:hypothetical protein
MSDSVVAGVYSGEPLSNKSAALKCGDYIGERYIGERYVGYVRANIRRVRSVQLMTCPVQQYGHGMRVTKIRLYAR